MKARGLLHHTPPEGPFGERFSPYLQSVNTRHNQRHLVVHIREDNIQISATECYTNTTAAVLSLRLTLDERHSSDEAGLQANNKKKAQ